MGQMFTLLKPLSHLLKIFHELHSLSLWLLWFIQYTAAIFTFFASHFYNKPTPLTPHYNFLVKILIFSLKCQLQSKLLSSYLTFLAVSCTDIICWQFFSIPLHTFFQCFPYTLVSCAKSISLSFFQSFKITQCKNFSSINKQVQNQGVLR